MQPDLSVRRTAPYIMLLSRLVPNKCNYDRERPFLAAAGCFLLEQVTHAMAGDFQGWMQSPSAEGALSAPPEIAALRCCIISNIVGSLVEEALSLSELDEVWAESAPVGSATGSGGWQLPAATWALRCCISWYSVGVGGLPGCSPAAVCPMPGWLLSWALLLAFVLITRTLEVLFNRPHVRSNERPLIDRGRVQ